MDKLSEYLRKNQSIHYPTRFEKINLLCIVIYTGMSDLGVSLFRWILLVFFKWDGET